MLRNSASGNYYGRFTLSGKQKWGSLETDVWTVAKLRLADERAKIERLRQTVAHLAAGNATMGPWSSCIASAIGRVVGVTTFADGEMIWAAIRK